MEPKPGRREFIGTLGAGAAGMLVGACGKCNPNKRPTGSASNAAQASAVTPTRLPLQLIEPDVKGEGPIPDVFLKYPKVHPDLVASDAGADEQQLFKSGRIMMYRDGMGGWYGMQRDQRKISPSFDMQPLPIFSALGGEPLAWGAPGAPVYYTFVKKGLGKGRTEEILRVLDWCAAPFGSEEYELNRYGVEGKHFRRARDGSPVATDLGRLEVADQYRLISGRTPVWVATAELPSHVSDSLAYAQATAKYLKPDLFEGIKLELPASYSKLLVTTEEKIRDVVRGRRPISDLDEIVNHWRRSGGDEGRAFFEKALADNGR